MPDYKKGKIYTIRCKNDDSLIYVGSTVESLCSRLSKHKFASKSQTQRILYSHVKDWNDWYIELYEDFPCERIEQLLQREGQVIREIGTLNKKIQGRTNQEYREDNILKKREIDKKYYHENKNKLQEYHKEWREDHKEHIQKYHKEFYESNKNKILEYYKEKITCDCGCIIRKGGLQKHKQSKKHIELMKNQTLNVCQNSS